MLNALLLVLLSSCNQVNSEPEESGRYSSGVEQYYLNEAELQESKAVALQGGMDELNRVIEFYLIYSDLEIARNRIELLRWLKVGIDMRSANHAKSYLSVVSAADIDCTYALLAAQIIDDDAFLDSVKRSESAVRGCLSRNDLSDVAEPAARSAAP